MLQKYEGYKYKKIMKGRFFISYKWQRCLQSKSQTNNTWKLISCGLLQTVVNQVERIVILVVEDIILSR